jgi:general secretion pathway protein G
MIKHLRDVQARRRGEELAESGFTLIELLVVIVVLGILAATVVFALSGVTGQSAVAACNSDAKTLDVAVQAYINSPDNSTNAPPTTTANLVTAGFNKTGDPLVSGTGDTFITSPSDNTAFAVKLFGELTPAEQTAVGAGTAADTVVVATPKTSTTYAVYDGAATNPCSAAS